MGLSAGTRLGPYEVVTLLGAGGMGEVYRARDTKLNRDVALKILPDTFAADLDRLARFRREAQVLAALNHSNIAAIHGFEDSGSRHALVLELVDGPTLADRIGKGPIPLDEALPIAKQIAEALEAAHEQGIIHRDLKPANIKLRPDGAVKVLDFGLAKALEPASGIRTDVTNSPTITSPALMTGVGMLLGTAAYMSPEQAKGRSAEKRSDIWAFGCVLFEMLTGTRAFEGEDVSETLASVLKSNPDWNRLPADTPESIRRLLRRALQKDARRRLAGVEDARLELEDASVEPNESGFNPTAGRTHGRRLWIGIMAVTSTAMVAFALAWARASLAGRDRRPEMRVEIVTPPTTDPVSFALSPDGQQLVFLATSEDRKSQLWLRSFTFEGTRPLEGTEGARYPFWSPDSRSIGFFADQKLKRLDLEGGAIQTIATAIAGRGGAWNRDNVIVFASAGGSPLYRVPAGGGEPTLVTQHDRASGAGHRFPQFLPDGDHFLFYAARDHTENVGSIRGTPQQRLFEADAAAAYVDTGQILFIRQGKLFAQDFDLNRLQLAGRPFLVTDQVMSATENAPALSVSSTRALAYRHGTTAATVRQLIWFDRSGRRLVPYAEPDRFGSVDPALSPDGRRVAVWRNVENPDVWVFDSDGRRIRFTSDPSADMFPVWSPDGNRIAYGSNRTGTGMNIYLRSLNGETGEQALLVNTPGQFASPVDWSRDGRFILYGLGPSGQASDLWAVATSGDRTPVPVARSRFTERLGQFSSDGKWVAYQSDESGRFEIYLQPFPGPGTKIVVSAGGGIHPRWRSDGQELFFLDSDERLMAVPIHRASNDAISPGVPTPLFTTNLGAAQPYSRQQYAVSADGQRFLMNILSEPASTVPITLVLNWKGHTDTR